MRRQGVGSILFKRLISEAQWRGYRRLRVTTGAENHAMRALATKFGANLVFEHGESTGTIELKSPPQAEFAKLMIDVSFAAARAMINFNRACWRLISGASGPQRTA